MSTQTAEDVFDQMTDTAPTFGGIDDGDLHIDRDNDGDLWGDTEDHLFDIDPPTSRAADEQVDEPDPTLIDPRKRSMRAKAYEKKTRGLFRTAFLGLCQSERTVADSAAIYMHAPEVSARLGDLADDTKWVARGIDWLSDGTENAAAALISASIPLVLQVVRNHEQAFVPELRGWKIPFTQRHFRLRFGVRLGKARNFTNDPTALTNHVFTNAQIQSALRKQGIRVAGYTGD